MINAIRYGNNKNGKVCFDFFQTMFPARFHLACSPDELKTGGVRRQIEKYILVTSFTIKMASASHFTKALYGAGHEWVGIEFIFQMEAADMRRNAEAQRLVHAAT
ncbi:hypothetical protein PG995_004939 [Apiospora arundinis]